MIIGVIGAGHLGTSVGLACAKGGHEIILSSRHPERIRTDAKNVQVSTIANCALEAEIILLATPYSTLPELARKLEIAISEKIVIDATNPDPSDKGELAETSRREGMGVTTQKYLKTAKVIRAFSSINAGNVTCSRKQPLPLAVPVAGDDEKAVEIVKKIVRDAGCVPVVTGNLASGRIFEWGNPGCFVNTNESDFRKQIKL